MVSGVLLGRETRRFSGSIRKLKGTKLLAWCPMRPPCAPASKLGRSEHSTAAGDRWVGSTLFLATDPNIMVRGLTLVSRSITIIWVWNLSSTAKFILAGLG